MIKKKNVFIGILSVIMLCILTIGISQNVLEAQANVPAKGDVCNEDCNGCLCEGNQGNIIYNKRTAAKQEQKARIR
jgi:hypothetical protein